ncbi:MAG TPA: hypothetical protein VFN26_22395 [Candidatus Acidoferrum sp.]|nr:hypothetical protein [Candidatus Acidoferrum sp.]
MPTSDDTIELALATPKEMLVSYARCRLQCFEDEIRQDYVHRLTRFLHVEKETAASDAVRRQLDGIADSHSAVAKQKDEASQSPGILHAVR